MRDSATKETDLRIHQDNNLFVAGNNGGSNRHMFVNLHNFYENCGIYKGCVRGDKTYSRRRIFTFAQNGFHKDLHMHGVDLIP